MRLAEPEQDILDGGSGPAAAWGLRYQLEVGRFFGAERLVGVRSAHVHCDAEALGEPGVAFLEEWARRGARVTVPLTLDPRSSDPARAHELRQDPAVAEDDRRIMDALRAMGAIPSNTCINYQTVDVPHMGERLAWGDTGTVIWANAVAGARSNFEGGPAAVAAALCGRVAAYGFQLDEHRRGTARVVVRDQPCATTDWGALGCLVGRAVPGYWEVPVIEGLEANPTPDELKHLGAALASYGSHAMFHLPGVTPEARSVAEAFGGHAPQHVLSVDPGDLAGVYESFTPERPEPDVIVLGTPQLSLFEFKVIADALAGRRVRTRVLLTTSAQVRAAADEHGWTDAVREAGALVLTGVCFYLMTARDLARRNGWRTLLTDSAKLANTIQGYGYEPALRPTDACLEAAVAGRLPW
jgi:predicted aconitase